MATHETVLNRHQEYLRHLSNQDIRQCLILELRQLRSAIEAMQLHQEELQCQNEVLQYEIDKLQKEMHSIKRINIAQPSYDHIQRVDSPLQLRMLSHSAMYDAEQNTEYHLIGQIIKRKHLSRIMFFEVFIAPKYLIKIALKKKRFDATRYHEIKTQCKLGSVIECVGKLETAPPNQQQHQLILEIEHKIEVIQPFEKRGFEPYRETNSNKSQTILCSHFVKHCVSSSQHLSSTADDSIPPLNVDLVPEICRQSKCQYRHRLINKSEARKIAEQIESRQQVLREEMDENDPFADSTNSKVARARLFGEWIVKKYGLGALQTNGVLDIAGGGGDLAAVLSEYHIPVTIVDPRKPDKMFKNMSKRRKKLDKHRNQQQHEEEEEKLVIPRHLDAYFEWDTLEKRLEIKRIFDQSEVILGLHPDQATEPIVDVSLKHNKSFAILPCCVFANLYPKFMHKQPVSTYTQFVEYLKMKNPRICTDYLPFKGRNKILYFDAH